MASNIMNQSVIDNEREVTSVTYEVLCVNSLEEVQQEIREHELEKSTKYITVKKDKMFGKEDIDLHNSEVRFEDTQKTTVPYIPADGVPFIIVGRKRMACHQGKDTHHKDKKRRKGNDNQIADHDYKKTRKLLQPTKKKNCMAGIRVRHVLKFPDYKLSENGKRSEKDAISLAIKHRIATGKPLQKQQAFFISIPNWSMSSKLSRTTIEDQITVENYCAENQDEGTNQSNEKNSKENENKDVHLLQSFKAFMSSTNKSDWINLIDKAQNTYHHTLDMTSSVGFSVLFDVCNDSDDLVAELMIQMTFLMPTTLPREIKDRLIHIISEQMVNEQIISLKVDDDPRVKAMERAKAINELLNNPMFESLKTTTASKQSTSRMPNKKNITWKDNTSRMQKKKNITWKDNPAHMKYSIPDIDEQKALNKVHQLWTLQQDTNYIFAKVYGYDVTDADIRSFSGRNWLTDQAIDSYLALIVQKEWDKGKKVKHVAYDKMTRIVSTGDYNQRIQDKFRVMDYSVIIGAYLQRRIHWNLVIVEPQKGLVHFMNPMGETITQRRTIINNWRNFMGKRLFEFPKDNRRWDLSILDHAKQTDSFNCGVYCLLFADRFLSDRLLTDISATDIKNEREEIPAKLLLYEVCLKDCCPCCGTELQVSHQKMQCTGCQRFFHKKPHCVGDDLAETDQQTFKCKLCI